MPVGAFLTIILQRERKMIMERAGKTFLKVCMVLVVAVVATSCMPATTVSERRNDGFLNGYYQYMTPGPKDGAKMRWLRPGVDFAKYDRVMLDSVVFFFANDSDYKGIDPNELKTIADECNLQVVNALKGSYPIVSSPGTDVIRIRFAITDLKPSKPVLSAVSSVVPVGLGMSIIKKGASGAWTGSGAVSAEIMVIDSMTGEVIAVAQDERSAGFTDRFSKWGAADEAFKFWGGRIKLLMDSLHNVKK